MRYVCVSTIMLMDNDSTSWQFVVTVMPLTLLVTGDLYRMS